MKLYTMPNTCALSAHIAMKWADLDIQVEVMPSGGSRMPAYLAVNRHGKVPALIIADGSVLTEAAAILPYLAELAPKARLGGTDVLERARIAQALGFMIGEVHSDWTPHYAPHLFLLAPVADSELEAMTFQRLAPQYAFLEEALGSNEWLLFGRRTIADAYLYMLARTADLMPGGLTPYPRLAAFRARLDRDRDVAAALAEQATHAGANDGPKPAASPELACADAP
jgi:glutathione S-transferase